MSQNTLFELAIQIYWLFSMLGCSGEFTFKCGVSRANHKSV